MDDFDDITCEEFYGDDCYDHLERDHDEAYEPDADEYVPDPDSAYDDQYELDTDYF